MAGPASACDPWGPAPDIDPVLGEVLDRLRVEAVSAVLWHCTPAWGIAPRVIPDEMVFLIRRGRGWLRIADRRIDLLPGVCAHIPRGVVHSSGTVDGSEIEVIAVHYQAWVEGALLGSIMDIPDQFSVDLDGEVDRALIAACREHRQRSGGWMIRREAWITAGLIAVLRTCRPCGLPTRLDDARRLLPALARMRETLAEAPSLADLARSCGLSSAHFRRCFHRAFGCAPIEHVHRLRIAEAARLLRSNGISVVEAAQRVGYQDPSWFSRTFRRLMGVAPGVYARQTGP